MTSHPDLMVHANTDLFFDRFPLGRKTVLGVVFVIVIVIVNALVLVITRPFGWDPSGCTVDGLVGWLVGGVALGLLYRAKCWQIPAISSGELGTCAQGYLRTCLSSLSPLRSGCRDVEPNESTSQRGGLKRSGNRVEMWRVSFVDDAMVSVSTVFLGGFFFFRIPFHQIG